MNQWRRIYLELKIKIVISIFFTDETVAAVDQLFVQRN